MKSDVLKFFNAVSAASKDQEFDYLIVVPRSEGVFIATNLGDAVIDSMPIDEITEKMRNTIKPPSNISVKGELH